MLATQPACVQVSKDVLKAMQQLISSILTGTNVADKHALVKTPKVNMREVLIWQLICGYKLRELEVRAM